MLTLKFSPAKIAQYYTLRQSGKTKQEARDIINSNSFEKIDESTHIKDNLLGAKRLFEKFILNGGTIEEEPFFYYDLKTSREYFYSVGDKCVINFDSEEQLCDTLAKLINTVCVEVLKENEITKKVFIKGLLLIEPIIGCCGYSLGKEDESEEFKFNLSDEMQIAYSTSQLSDDFILNIEK